MEKPKTQLLRINFNETTKNKNYINTKIMGYYTRHELTVINGDQNIDYEQEIADFTDGYDKSALWEESIKWYDCEKHMLKYSKKHPNVTFLIYGEGEESTDIWKSYFKNGKNFTTKAKLVFEDYSEDKLQ